MTAFPASASSLAFLADQRAAGAQFWLLSPLAHVGTLQFCIWYRVGPTLQQRAASGSVVFCELCCNPHPQRKKVLGKETLVFLSSSAFVGWILMPGSELFFEHRGSPVPIHNVKRRTWNPQELKRVWRGPFVTDGWLMGRQCPSGTRRESS